MKRFETGDYVRFRNGTEIGMVTQTFERTNTAMLDHLEQFKIIIRFRHLTATANGPDAIADLILVRESSAKGDTAMFSRTKEKE